MAAWDFWETLSCQAQLLLIDNDDIASTRRGRQHRRHGGPEAHLQPAGPCGHHPLPDSVPKVKEVGATSAPLLSASFFIGARCRPYNDDYMQCKTENPGKGEFECMKEGRRVTRCAASVVDDINKHCLDEFRKHWQCLDNNNHQLWQCRKDEWKLNKCVFDNLKLEKTIPEAQGIPVHLRSKQIYAHYPALRDPGQAPFKKAIDAPGAEAPAS
ncbi:hypothetical protein PG984_011868 [Apiospora sp. TS-2023a]